MPLKVSKFLSAKVSKFSTLLLCYFSTLLLFNSAHAQTDTTFVPQKHHHKAVLCEIKMKDGTAFTGYIQHQTDSTIFLKGSQGVVLQIPKHNVQNIYHIKPHAMHDTTGGVPTYNPNIANKYYVATSNAFLFKAREVYGSSNYLLFYNFNYAINQHISAGISSSILFAPVALHLKVNYEVARKLYLGFDGMFGSGSWLSYRSFGGGGLAKLTYGDLKRNYTFFAGFGDVRYYGLNLPFGGRGRGGGRHGTYTNTSNGGGSAYGRHRGGGGRRGIKPGDDYSVIIAAATSIAISPKVYFVAEAYAYPGVKCYALNPGIRTNIKPKISWVVSALGVYNTSSSSVLVIPYLGFSFKF